MEKTRYSTVRHPQLSDFFISEMENKGWGKVAISNAPTSYPCCGDFEDLEERKSFTKDSIEVENDFLRAHPGEDCSNMSLPGMEDVDEKLDTYGELEWARACLGEDWGVVLDTKSGGRLTPMHPLSAGDGELASHAGNTDRGPVEVFSSFGEAYIYCANKR